MLTLRLRKQEGDKRETEGWGGVPRPLEMCIFLVFVETAVQLVRILYANVLFFDTIVHLVRFLYIYIYICKC